MKRLIFIGVALALVLGLIWVPSVGAVSADSIIHKTIGPGCPEETFAFEAWHTWMDPLAHANHPLDVDWIDEALGRALAAAGADPHGLVAIGEEVSWRAGVEAGDQVRVETRRVGRTADGAVVSEHDVVVGDRVCATARTVRSHVGGPDVLADALGAGPQAAE